MFSYRHAFHAGNHADVLKHTVLIAVLKHLVQKEAPLAVFDTHAGAGLYRLDGDYAQTSAEAAEGILRLKAAARGAASAGQGGSAAHSTAISPGDGSASRLPEPLEDYLEMVAAFNAGDSFKIYPGSPFIIQRLLRAQDRLKLFELHPTDFRTLSANIGQLEAGRQVAVSREDGFEGLRKFLPPPQRRALVLIDPSYELKPDYGRVLATVGDSLKRFATGTYVVWYPIIARPEAHELPRKLKTLCGKVGRPWLLASLSIKSSKIRLDAGGTSVRPGLPASGVFVVNPPHTLKAALQSSLPHLVAALAQDRHAAHVIEAGS